MVWFLSFIIFFLCLLITSSVDIKKNLFAKVVLIIFAIFQVFSFSIRPIYLVMFNPTNKEFLADRRLYPEYAESLPRAMILEIFYLTLIFACLRFLLRDKSIKSIVLDTEKFKTQLQKDNLIYFLLSFQVIAILAYLLGAIYVWRATNIFGSLGLALFFLYAEFRSVLQKFVAVSLFTIQSLVGLFIFESKFVLSLPGLFLIIRFLNSTKTKLQKNFTISLLAIFSAVIFPVLQNLTGKGLSTLRLNLTPVVDSLISIFERFDGLVSVIDAMALNGSQWMSTYSYMKLAFNQFIIKGIIFETEYGVGQLWNMGLRNVNQVSRKSITSVAFGVPAEGFAMWQYWGIFFSSICWSVVVFLIFLSKLSHTFLGHVFAISISCGNNAIFENGILSLLGAVNKGFQCIFLIWLYYMFTARKLPKSIAVTKIYHHD